MANPSDERKIAERLNEFLGKTAARRIDAVAGWKSFFEQNKDISKGSLKPKLLCEHFPELLIWQSDDSAPGCGWITYVKPSRTAKESSAIVRKLSSSEADTSLVRAAAKAMEGMAVSISNSFHEAGSEISFTATKVSQEREILETIERPKFDLLFVIDVSGSMIGDPSFETYKAVNEIIESLLPNDRVGLILFNESVSEAVPLKMKKNLKTKFIDENYLDESGACFKCEGGTALWDAILAAMKILATRRMYSESHPHLVILTDGNDRDSKVATQDKIKGILLQPGDYAKNDLKQSSGVAFSNFHATWISLGDEAANNFKSLGKTNLHHLDPKNASEISINFREVHTKMEIIRTKTQKFSLTLEETVQEEVRRKK